MGDKVDFSDIQTLASILNRIERNLTATATLEIYEHFTRDEVLDIESLFHQDFTAKEISEIYGTDSIKVKRVIRLINKKR